MLIAVAKAAGDITAAPMPCIARPASSATGPDETAHSSEAAVNTVRPSSTDRRAPARSAIRPPSSISPPKSSV
jgi:hypothetical protein